MSSQGRDSRKTGQPVKIRIKGDSVPLIVSLHDKFRLAGGHPTGFDYMRLALAIGVVCIHAPLSSYGSDAVMYTSVARPVVRAILPMFFALSGYLVAGSLLRSTSLLYFLSLRAIRIYPALSVEVLLSAFVIGPILTTLSLTNYFEHSLFREYLLNVTGHIHYRLPGVFATNPLQNTVNAQLWTVPFELLCYVSLAALTMAGLKKHLWFAPVSALVLTLCYVVVKVHAFHGLPPVIEGHVSGLFLLVAFLCGVSLYLYGDKVSWSRTLCLMSGGLTLALLGVVPNGDYIAAPFAAYFTVSLGLMNPAKISLLKGADYSYGIFLYGFVIQQLLMATLPWAREWWLNIALSVPLAALVASGSWHFVEKPAQQLKRFIPKKIGLRRSYVVKPPTT